MISSPVGSINAKFGFYPISFPLHSGHWIFRSQLCEYPATPAQFVLVIQESLFDARRTFFKYVNAPKCGLCGGNLEHL